MSTSYDQKRRQLTSKICAAADKQLSEKEAALFKEFVSRFCVSVAVDDLQERQLSDVYGQFYSVWQALSVRKPNETKVDVYNPEQAKDGWESQHSILTVVTDDIPFLVDSVRMEVEQQGFQIHLIMHVGGLQLLRDKSSAKVTRVVSEIEHHEDASRDAVIYIELDRQVEPKVFAELSKGVEKILNDAQAAVKDWKPMRQRLQEAYDELDQNPPPLDSSEVAESRDFLRWLEYNFIFLGYREYRLVESKGEKALELVQNSGLGVLKKVTAKTRRIRPYSEMSTSLREATEAPQLLIFAKTNTVSTVHRAVFTDLVSVRYFDKNGELIGERRFVGLYTSRAYATSPKQIPFLRHKVSQVKADSHLSIDGHSGKALAHILETFPLDDLMQASASELLSITMGVLHVQERPQVKLFVRQDVYSRFYSCLVFMPRERFDISLCEIVETMLLEELDGVSASFTANLSDDSNLVRLHYIVRVQSEHAQELDVAAIEQKLIDISRCWEDELREYLIEHFGEAVGVKFYNKYRRGFPVSYQESHSVQDAANDIEFIESLDDAKLLAINTYGIQSKIGDLIGLRLFRREQPTPLCDALPVLENMNLRVISERPYKLVLANGEVVWINDFAMNHAAGKTLEVDSFKEVFEKAFMRIWHKDVEDDGFNKLVVDANLTWKQVNVLRAYTKYLSLIGSTFSARYVEAALINNSHIALSLVSLFDMRFQPATVHDEQHEASMQSAISHIEAELDQVLSLDEDRILRRLLEIIQLTNRTNYYQTNSEGGDKNYLSFKICLNADKIHIADLPLPLPMYEIFVYSARVEGVHLRGGKVARGGLRWSDRREDFRTEVLGLMKAQQVKNSVIVPTGAKGGFIVKSLPQNGTREEIMNEAISCYKIFISALLDLTDNVKKGKVVHPDRVARYDEDDSYLVVAADKGTATFSDIANEVAQSYDFWLGDAFASGGSAGYDHKKMGITARGAWESVKRHFSKLGVNCQEQDITVVGIGDMSGDVFGNGMLLSRHIKLVAAFNHMHIFIDPDPNPALSYAERQRLFELPRSSWTDYNEKLISAGGGVYSRSAKSIKLSKQARTALNLKRDVMTPTELLRAILEAKVDLLWNGGIGTYVKSSKENHIDVGDRANDSIRTDGNRLHCKVVGEGGNLGLTQLARVEFALQGGLIYTDFIDNSAGVNCSDHEVNIKILLNDVVSRGELNEKQRNKLLAEMTSEVAELVLDSNVQQTHSISLAASASIRSLPLFRDFIKHLEDKGQLNREIEYLPSSKDLLERRSVDKHLVQPEIAVLMAYSKNTLKEQLLETGVPEEAYFVPHLISEFPKKLVSKYEDAMHSHMLRREIIATQLSNDIVNHMGVHFISRLQQETGSTISAIVRAYSAAEAIFNFHDMWRKLQGLETSVDMELQFKVMLQVSHAVRRTTRWLLRNRKMISADIQHVVDQFKKPVAELTELLPAALTKSDKQAYSEEVDMLLEAGFPPRLASQVAKFNFILPALDIAEAAARNPYTVREVAKTFFALGERLNLNAVRQAIRYFDVDNRWEELARSSLRDDLDFLQRKLSVSVLRMKPRKKTTVAQVKYWVIAFEPILTAWFDNMRTLQASENLDLIVYSVVIRDLLDLAQACEPSTLRLLNREASRR